MRHRIAGNKLGRNSSWRKATLRDIAKATLVRQRICTTQARAKEARKLVDRLITLGKKGTLAHRRKSFSILCDHKLVSQLFTKIAPRFSKRQGGYTRIIPVSHRRGDNARLVYLELTEKEEVVLSKARTAATSKAKKLDVSSITKTGDQEQASQEHKVSAEETVAQHKKEVVPPDKDKKPKKMGGGIRKIFRRKTAE